MKEVKKCSISGIAFTLDNDAYVLLDRYLESLKAAYAETADGDEIVADIEARIAELILSRQENSRVVEAPLLQQVISQMGTAEDISSESDADTGKKQPRIPRRLYRDTQNARLGGVCAGLGRYFDIDGERIRHAVGSYMPDNNRSQRTETGRNTLIVDCYNANPQSVTAALEVLGRTDCERRVAVLGDMGELGDLTDQAHFNAGALAAMLGIDFVIAIGSKAARIADGAAMSGGDVVHFATKEEALPTVREQLRPNTSMLIKASHSMRFERLTEDLRKYYD